MSLTRNRSLQKTQTAAMVRGTALLDSVPCSITLAPWIYTPAATTILTEGDSIPELVHEGVPPEVFLALSFDGSRPRAGSLSMKRFKMDRSPVDGSNY